jgi:hypothetical protein
MMAGMGTDVSDPAGRGGGPPGSSDQMSPSSQATDAPPRAAPWAGPVAFAASTVAFVCVALFCASTLRAGQDWRSLPWLHGASGPAAVGIVVWLCGSLLGTGLGAVALVNVRRRVWAVLAIVVGAAALLGAPTTVAAYGLWLVGPHHPSDDELIGRFQQHQGQFERAMSVYRATGRVRAFSGLDVEAGTLEGGHKQATITLRASTWGLVPSGSEKGYAFSRKPLHPTTKGETEHYPGNMPQEIVYRHIVGPWYFYYSTW